MLWSQRDRVISSQSNALELVRCVLELIAWLEVDWVEDKRNPSAL